MVECALTLDFLVGEPRKSHENESTRMAYLEAGILQSNCIMSCFVERAMKQVLATGFYREHPIDSTLLTASLANSSYIVSFLSWVHAIVTPMVLRALWGQAALFLGADGHIWTLVGDQCISWRSVFPLSGLFTLSSLVWHGCGVLAVGALGVGALDPPWHTLLGLAFMDLLSCDSHSTAYFGHLDQNLPWTFPVLVGMFLVVLDLHIWYRSYCSCRPRDGRWPVLRGHRKNHWQFQEWNLNCRFVTRYSLHGVGWCVSFDHRTDSIGISVRGWNQHSTYYLSALSTASYKCLYIIQAVLKRHFVD